MCTRPTCPFGFQASLAHCDSAPLAGKSGDFDITDAFSGVFKSLATLCVCAHVSDASVSSLGRSDFPMRGCAPLVGNFGVADAFAGLFMLPALRCMCMCVLCVPGPLSSPSISSGQEQ